MANGRDLSELVRRTVQANAKFYKGWLDLTFEYVRGVSEILGAPPQGTSPNRPVDADVGPGAVVLEGEAGTVASGSFLLANDMDKPTSCTFAASEFTGPGGAIKANLSFDPEQLTLAPGDERVVQVTTRVGDALEAGVGYSGEVVVRGMEAFSVPVVLRRRHSVDDASAGDPDSRRAAQPPDGASSQAAAAKRRTPPRTRQRKKEPSR